MAHDSDGDEMTQAAANKVTARAFLRAVPILSALDDRAIERLAEYARPHIFAAGTQVIDEGEECDAFYVVRAGQADVLKRDPTGMDIVVARLGVGSYFGELGLLTNKPRSASIRVRETTDLSVFVFDAQQFHEIIAEHVLVFRIQREQRSMQANLRDRRLRIRQIDVLRDMPPAELDLVARDALERQLATGEIIIRQGDPGDRFYVLLSGEVQVERHGQELARLDPGAFFGETALLFDQPRNATVRATRPSVVWSISRSAFQRVVGHYLLAHAESSETIIGRL